MQKSSAELKEEEAKKAKVDAFELAMEKHDADRDLPKAVPSGSAGVVECSVVQDCH